MLESLIVIFQIGKRLDLNKSPLKRPLDQVGITGDSQDDEAIKLGYKLYAKHHDSLSEETYCEEIAQAGLDQSYRAPTNARRATVPHTHRLRP